MTEWRDDLKLILKHSALYETHGVFLFTDTQIKEESFLEDINNLLNAGEIPNLFPTDEKAEICERMRQIDRWGQSLYCDCCSVVFGANLV